MKKVNLLSLLLGVSFALLILLPSTGCTKTNNCVCDCHSTTTYTRTVEITTKEECTKLDSRSHCDCTWKD